MGAFASTYNFSIDVSVLGDRRDGCVHEEFCGTENGQASAAFRIIIISLPPTYHRGALLYRLRLYPLNLPDNAVKGKGRITK